MPTLDWIGKDKVINHHQEVPYRILERQYSFDENGQHAEDNGSPNMIIHGDNLEALKSLLPRYEGRIKCIYIDPPYNTGIEKWIYNDNVNDPKIRKWLGEVVGKEGDDLSRHDKWLCMMYPRLMLLYKLLAEDGVIFISIDDNEASYLKAICDEIFGRRNLLKQFIWHTEGHTDNQDIITHVHEYILAYAKDIELVSINNIVDPNTPADSKILRDFAENSITKNGSKNPPSTIVLPTGFPCLAEDLIREKLPQTEDFLSEVENLGYISRDLTKKYEMSYPVVLDKMEVKNFQLIAPCEVFSGWMNNGKLLKFIANGCKPIEDKDSLLEFFLSNNGVIYYRRTGRTPRYIQTVLQNMGTTETNKYMLERMGISFDYPKPVELLSFILRICGNDGDYFLDSFAGSGSVGHAILALNSEEKMERKFILVELNDYAETITAERAKKVILGFGKGRDYTPGTGGNFSFYELGAPLLTSEGYLNEAVGVERIREYMWYMETRSDLPKEGNGNPHYLGTSNSTSYYFYYQPGESTALDYDFLETIPERTESIVIYADRCHLSEKELTRFGITFKKIPRDITKL